MPENQLGRGKLGCVGGENEFEYEYEIFIAQMRELTNLSSGSWQTSLLELTNQSSGIFCS